MGEADGRLKRLPFNHTARPKPQTLREIAPLCRWLFFTAQV